MGFYEQISRYYDYIFPTGGQQLEFIKEAAGPAPCKVLDVACGSGGYSVELARAGYDMTAVDLDDEMVDKAKVNAVQANLNFNVLKGNMLELEKIFPERADSLLHSPEQKFRCIFCIGNSIVHLGSVDEIGQALLQMHKLLCKGGSLVLQIINYDRIIKYGITELPTIRNADLGLEFIRKYQYIREKGVINFNTTIIVGEDGEKNAFNNSIELLPLQSADMLQLLREAGFVNVDFYGDFKYSPYNDNSFMLVVKATK